MLSQNNPEVEIAIDSISSPNSIKCTEDSFSSTKKRTPTVYICGLLPKRYHNQSLYAIAHDLMSEFFVSTNPLQQHRWTAENTREMLKQTEALIFLLNDATIIDRRCLLTLQYAWELDVHIVMLRQPRVRLIIKPASAADKSAVLNRAYDPFIPYMPLLQDLIYDAYKHSLEYDRNNHLAGMRKLTTRIRQLVDSHKSRAESLQMKMTTGSAIRHPNHSGENHLKLPSIPSPPNSMTGAPVLRRNTISGLAIRSSSLSNLVKRQPQTPWKEANGNGVWSSHNGHHDDVVNGQQCDLTHHLLTPFESTDDPALYHETQYLVFPLKDKNQKPRLIRFPSALTDKQDDDEIGSIWGSDTSLEEEVERATQVAGGLSVDTPPRTPAPYIDPL